MKGNWVITIDGPAGCGKSTVAAQLAKRFSAAYLDTGAMYRAVTLLALQGEVDLDDAPALSRLARQVHMALLHRGDGHYLCLNGAEVDEAIRSSEVTEQAHKIARVPEVREILVAQQRRIAQETGFLVTEGRDQGTVVFPEARFKFYLDARPGCRAERRRRQLEEQGIAVAPEEVLASQQRRDQRDKSRRTGALRPADDAIIVDTTDMTAEEVVEKLYDYIIKEQSK